MTSSGLGPIVAAIGGDLYAGGQRACVPGPGHGLADRSLSLLLDDGRVVAHSFAGDDWRIALADLQARGLIDSDGRLLSAPGAGPGLPAIRPAPAERMRVARALWAAGRDLTERSAAARHLRRRGIEESLADLADLRANPAAPVSVYRPGAHRCPALLAGVRAVDGEICAVEITYLTADGQRAERLALSRKTIGAVPPGAAVRLNAAGPGLLVGEGVFTTLSAGTRFCWPCWALLSTANLRRWRAPAGVRRVVIAGDRGADGERSAAILAAALRQDGVEVQVRFPPIGCGDWNDLQCAGG